MSTVREACTKQHLDEFIGLLQKSKEGEVLLLPFTRDAVVQVDVAGRSVVLRDGLL